MSRLRKAARFSSHPKALDDAARAMVEPDDLVFEVNLAKIFARPAPLEVEIGAGKGEFIIAYAAAHPQRNFLAVELSAVIARMLAIRCGRAALPNLRVIRADGRTLTGVLLEDSSVSAYHIYFPDPWPKARHIKHRLFTPTLLASLRRTLEPSGRLHFATDVKDRAVEIYAMLQAGGFARIGENPPGARTTGFARKYVSEGKQLYFGVFSTGRPAQ